MNSPLTSPALAASNGALSGQTALVTGASRGIGAAVARRLAAEGANLILHHGTGVAETQALAAELRAAGGRVDTVQADLAEAAGPRVLGAAIAGRRIDILVNNAGVAPFATVEAMDETTFDRLAAINMRSLFFVTQTVLAQMPDGGRIVNLSSAVTRTVFPGIPAYAATKGFVDVLTLQLAGALGARRITVNAVAPGAIDTRMSAWIHGPGGTDVLQQIQALPGIGQPAQVAGVVAFLVGPDGGWTTGQIIDASGGTKL
jgi:3-oxoacyl-[acyl-carrier protein] reductase